MERTALALAAVFGCLGCQGPTEGPASGTVAFRDESAEVTRCDWRERVNGAGEPDGFIVYAESAVGLVTMRRAPDGDVTVLWVRPGFEAEECPGTFGEATGAWTVSADCPSGAVEATITGCMMAD
jgi:hypothetical protein